MFFAVLLAVSSALFRPLARSSWLAEEVYEDYDTVLVSFPETSFYSSAVGELFSTQKEAVCRLSDWVFTQGYAAVKGRRSSRNNLHMRCVYWGSAEGKNHRKLTDDARKRKNTHVQGKKCPWEIRGGRPKGRKDGSSTRKK